MIEINSIIPKIRSFFRVEKTFFLDVSLVFSSKAIITFAGLLITPVLTRLFPPVAYGNFALYSTVVQNMVVLGSLSLPLAITSSKEDWTTKIAGFAFKTSTLFFLVFGIGLLMFKRSLDGLFGMELFSNYWHLMLASFLFTNYATILASINVRIRNFKLNSVASVAESALLKSCNLITGISGLSSLGFMISEIIGKIGIILILAWRSSFVFKLSIGNYGAFRETLSHVRNFPLYILPSQWINILNNQLILWLIAYQFSNQQLGQYSLAVSLLNMPLVLLSNSFEPVITQRLTVLRDKGDRSNFFIKMIGILMVSSTVIFSLTYFIPNHAYVLILGENWNGMADFIKILCWAYLFIFVDRSLQSAFVVYHMQRKKLTLSFFEFLVQIVSLWIAKYLEFEILELIFVFAVVKISTSLVRLFYIVLASKQVNQ